MLGISFSELLVILVIGLIITRPSDIPHLAKAYRNFIKKFMHIKNEFSSNIQSLHNEIIDITPEEKRDAEDMDNHHYILDDDGKLQKAYDIKDLQSNQKK